VGKAKRRRRRAFEQGVADGQRKVADDMLRAIGQRPGDATEPVDMDSEERESYNTGRNSALTKAGYNG
jgi:hypothetical protein